LLHHQWGKGNFIDDKGELKLDIQPYRYKMIRSADFHLHFKQKIESLPNISWIEDEIIDIDIKACVASSKDQSYTADLIFDSRFDTKELKKSKSPMVLQHFKGWFIETEEELFDSESFTMMDFRLPFKDLCSFTYILPISKTSALIEYTFFSPEVLEEEVYDKLIKEYIEKYIKTDAYRITETEFGVIPMSNHAFHQYNTANYTRIGTAGGWVKASSGYSFKHAEKKSAKIAENVSKGLRPDKDIFNMRSRFYDRIFLNLLQNENHLGNDIFIQMYRKNCPHAIFRFLDEESSLFEELSLINRFKYAPFLRAVGRGIL